MSTIKNLLETRFSANSFDTNRQVTETQIEELIRLATLAPSAYNFQNWKFIAVTSSAAKEKLKSAAYNQQKVVDAGVTFIVCGTLNAHRSLESILSASQGKGMAVSNLKCNTREEATEQRDVREAVGRAFSRRSTTGNPNRVQREAAR